MGRPLFSTYVLQPSPPAVRVADAETSCPIYEKWTPWNSFDPDSDEYWKGREEIEEFLTPQQIAERSNIPNASILRPEEPSESAIAVRMAPESSTGHVDVPVLVQISDDSSVDSSDSGRSSPSDSLIPFNRRGADNLDEYAPRVGAFAPADFLRLTARARARVAQQNQTGVTYMSPDTYRIATSAEPPRVRPRGHSRSVSLGELSNIPPRDDSFVLPPEANARDFPPFDPTNNNFIHTYGQFIDEITSRMESQGTDVRLPPPAPHLHPIRSTNNVPSSPPPPLSLSHSQLQGVPGHLPSFSNSHPSRMALSHIAPPFAPYLGPLRLDQ